MKPKLSSVLKIMLKQFLLGVVVILILAVSVFLVCNFTGVFLCIFCSLGLAVILLIWVWFEHVSMRVVKLQKQKRRRKKIDFA